MDVAPPGWRSPDPHRRHRVPHRCVHASGEVRRACSLHPRHEGGGIVEAVGEGVTPVAVGDHVIPPIPPNAAAQVLQVGQTNPRNCRATRQGLMPTAPPASASGRFDHHYMGCRPSPSTPCCRFGSSDPERGPAGKGLPARRRHHRYRCRATTAKVKRATGDIPVGIGLAAIIGAKMAPAGSLPPHQSGKFAIAEELAPPISLIRRTTTSRSRT